MRAEYTVPDNNMQCIQPASEGANREASRNNNIYYPTFLDRITTRLLRTDSARCMILYGTLWCSDGMEAEREHKTWAMSNTNEGPRSRAWARSSPVTNNDTVCWLV